MKHGGITYKPLACGDIISYGMEERFGWLKLRKRVIIKDLLITSVEPIGGIYYRYEGVLK